MSNTGTIALVAWSLVCYLCGGYLGWRIGLIDGRREAEAKHKMRQDDDA